MMKKIALATCREFAELTAEDKLLADHLRKTGFDVHPLIWNEADQNLTDNSAVVIRSCWDYHKQPQEFLRWLRKLERNGLRILNAPAIIRWNIDKTYLRELEQAGMKIPPTEWIEKGKHADLAGILAKYGWQKAVLKPTISATAWKTFIVTPENAGELQAGFKDLTETSGAMVQQFIEEIQTQGEWSFIYFDKKFSHAVLKRAKPDDFRVQSNFGGTVETTLKPAPALIEAAQKIIEKIDGDLLYARVDGVETANGFCLMELELIEPVLFLDSRPAAASFAAAIARYLEIKDH